MSTPQNWECVQDILQSCADEVPESFIKFCPCVCNTEAVIYICNSNHWTDDNFDVKLNGTNIGSLNLISEPYGEEYCASEGNNAPGGWWSTSTDITPHTIGSSGGDCVPDNQPNDRLWSCCVNGLTTFTLSKSLFIEGSNTLEMINTADNGEGNFGHIGIFHVNSTGYICEHVIDQTYSGAGGEDFDFDFDWSWGECGAPVPLGFVNNLYIRKNNKIYLNTEYYKKLKHYKKNNKKIKNHKDCLMKSMYAGKTKEEGGDFKREMIQYHQELKTKGLSVNEIENLLAEKIVKNSKLTGGMWSKIEDEIQKTIAIKEDCNCRRKLPTKNIKLN